MDKKIQDGINSVLDGKETDFKWVDDKVQSGIAVTDVKTANSPVTTNTNNLL